jgi:hypothetical protein
MEGADADTVANHATPPTEGPAAAGACPDDARLLFQLRVYRRRFAALARFKPSGAGRSGSFTNRYIGGEYRCLLCSA